ncbi:MAG: AMP-binding protein, partial [Caldimonas sp.]
MNSTSRPDPQHVAGLPERFNAAAYLLGLNAERPDAVAYIDDTTRLTFGQLDDRVRRCAAGLLALGLRREERVLMVMHDSVDFPVAFLGALYAGIVPVPVNTLLTADDYAFMLEHCRARAVVVSCALWPALEKAVTRERRMGPALPVVASGPGAAPSGSEPFASLLEFAACEEPADTLADDFGFWLYSSGSTGRPKGTVHTHANLYWTAALYAEPVLGL